MNTLKIKALIVLACFTFLFSSCSEGFFMSTEEKIIGKWSYEKVKSSKWFKSTDITRDFRDIYWEFHANYTVVYTDDNTGDIVNGTWFVEEVCDYYANGEASSCTENIVMTIDFWENVTVSLNEINFSDGSVAGGTNCYRLTPVP